MDFKPKVHAALGSRQYMHWSRLVKYTALMLFHNNYSLLVNELRYDDEDIFPIFYYTCNALVI